MAKNSSSVVLEEEKIERERERRSVTRIFPKLSDMAPGKEGEDSLFTKTSDIDIASWLLRNVIAEIKLLEIEIGSITAVFESRG